MTRFAIMALLATSSFAGLSRNVGSASRYLKRSSDHSDSRRGGGSSTSSYSDSYYEGYGEDKSDYGDAYCYNDYYASDYDYYYGETHWSNGICPSTEDSYYEMAYSCDLSTHEICSWSTDMDDDTMWMEEGYASASALASAGIALVASAMMF